MILKIGLTKYLEFYYNHHIYILNKVSNNSINLNLLVTG